MTGAKSNPVFNDLVTFLDKPKNSPKYLCECLEGEIPPRKNKTNLLVEEEAMSL